MVPFAFYKPENLLVMHVDLILKTSKLIGAALFAVFTFATPVLVSAQGSPDSRICNCFTEPVPSNFMSGTKVAYGTIALYLSPGLELPPKQQERVKFTIPLLSSKQGCTSWYSIYITDEQNNKVYESAGMNNEITYSFPDCEKTYTVQLLAYSKSANGGDGNCTRRISFVVKPRCNTASCSCTGAAYKLSGEVQCLGRTGSENRYSLRYSISNLSDCILTITTITILGQTIEIPPSKIAPKASLTGISLGFSTPASTPIYTDTKVGASTRFMLNNRKCSETMQLPYKRCPG